MTSLLRIFAIGGSTLRAMIGRAFRVRCCRRVKLEVDMFPDSLLYYDLAIERHKELLREAEKRRMIQAWRTADRLEKQRLRRYRAGLVLEKECFEGTEPCTPLGRTA